MLGRASLIPPPIMESESSPRFRASALNGQTTSTTAATAVWYIVDKLSARCLFLLKKDLVFRCRVDYDCKTGTTPC